MKYPYAVKHNGKWYRPNQEVPDKKPTKGTEESEPKKPVVKK